MASRFNIKSTFTDIYGKPFLQISVIQLRISAFI